MVVKAYTEGILPITVAKTAKLKKAHFILIQNVDTMVVIVCCQDTILTVCCDTT